MKPTRAPIHQPTPPPILAAIITSIPFTTRDPLTGLPHQTFTILHSTFCILHSLFDMPHDLLDSGAHKESEHADAPDDHRNGPEESRVRKIL